MIGDNAPAWLVLTNGTRSAPTMISSTSEYVPGSRSEYHKEYNRTHKASHHKKRDQN
jgi:hypothetical protein